MDRFSIVILLCLCFSFKVVKSQNVTTTEPTCTEIWFKIDNKTCINYIYIYVDENCVDSEKLSLAKLLCAGSVRIVFDSSQTRYICVLANTTMCQQTTTAPTTTTSASLCYRSGRFRIPDVKCKKYYLCYWNGTSLTKMDNLLCPNTLVFDPTSEKCVLPQTYPCSGT